MICVALKFIRWPETFKSDKKIKNKSRADLFYYFSQACVAVVQPIICGAESSTLMYFNSSFMLWEIDVCVSRGRLPSGLSNSPRNKQGLKKKRAEQRVRDCARCHGPRSSAPIFSSRFFPHFSPTRLAFSRTTERQMIIPSVFTAERAPPPMCYRFYLSLVSFFTLCLFFFFFLLRTLPALLW